MRHFRSLAVASVGWAALGLSAQSDPAPRQLLPTFRAGADVVTLDLSVLFEFGARGIPGIRHGVHAYVAATEEEFLRYVEEALRHPEANRGIATEARRLIERGYEWDSYKDDLDAILRGSGTRALEAGAT